MRFARLLANQAALSVEQARTASGLSPIDPLRYYFDTILAAALTMNRDYAEAIATLSWERGNTGARGGVAWAPRQANLIDAAGTKSANLYGFVGVEQAIAGTPISLTFDLGYEAGAFDGAARGGKLDWRGGIAVSQSGFTVSASYVGAVRPHARTGERRRENGMVLALGRSF